MEDRKWGFMDFYLDIFLVFTFAFAIWFWFSDKSWHGLWLGVAVIFTWMAIRIQIEKDPTFFELGDI